MTPRQRRSRAYILPYLQTQARSDAEIRRFLMAAARGVESQLAGPIANALSLEQPRLVLDALKSTMDGVWKGTERTIVGFQPQVALDSVKVSEPVTRALFEAAGKDYAPIKKSLEERALFAVKSGINRFGTKNIPLSARVHQSAALANGWLDNRVSSLIAQGANAKTIAEGIKNFIRPDVPGGVSYAALRVGRTELNTTFHRMQKETAAAQPWVLKVRWELSGSHPYEDECDDLVGEYDIDNVPDPPHPQCLCHLEEVTMTDDQFVEYVNSPAFEREFGTR